MFFLCNNNSIEKLMSFFLGTYISIIGIRKFSILLLGFLRDKLTEEDYKVKVNKNNLNVKNNRLMISIIEEKI